MEQYMKKYVVGFMIDPQGRTLLVTKDRPEIWAGLVTGPGGKVEPGESFAAAMVREFREETTIETVASDWKHVATVRTGVYEVAFFRADGDPRRFHQVESELLEVYSALMPPRQMFANARWALALALDSEIDGPVIVNYTGMRGYDAKPTFADLAGGAGGQPRPAHTYGRVALNEGAD